MLLCSSRNSISQQISGVSGAIMKKRNSATSRQTGWHFFVLFASSIILGGICSNLYNVDKVMFLISNVIASPAVFF